MFAACLTQQSRSKHELSIYVMFNVCSTEQPWLYRHIIIDVVFVVCLIQQPVRRHMVVMFVVCRTTNVQSTHLDVLFDVCCLSLSSRAAGKDTDNNVMFGVCCLSHTGAVQQTRVLNTRQPEFLYDRRALLRTGMYNKSLQRLLQSILGRKKKTRRRAIKSSAQAINYTM